LKLVKPTALGPNLLCILAIVFLSAIVTRATDNKTGLVTAKTSRTDIIVGKYNIVNKNNDIKITYKKVYLK
jgi:hypothetical protein